MGPTPDGYYVMFLLGEHQPYVADCAHGIDPSWVGPGDQTIQGHIKMGYSKSPTGPWSPPRTILRNDLNPKQNRSAWDCFVTNPAGLLLPNGTVMLVFRSGPCDHFSEALGVAFALHWNGTYVQDETPLWRKTGPAHERVPRQGLGNVEDPFVWRDKRDNFHIIAHSQGTVNLCQDNNTEGWKPGNSAGVHFFAESPRGPWHHSEDPAYCGDVLLGNGTSAHLMTRQRPQLVFRTDGFTPHLLFMGGSFTEYNQGTTSLAEHTFAFEFV